MPHIQLGLCCLNTELREQKPPIFCSRTCRMATLQEKGLSHAKALIEQNLRDLVSMIHWNYENGIRVFRMSSDMFPHITNHRIELPGYKVSKFKRNKEKIGDFARFCEQRITFHPGQFNVLGTPRPEVLKTTIHELGVHAQILDFMGCDEHSVMVIHGGGVYGDKEATKRRWIENYNALPEYIRNRLVLENCEKNFNIQDCLDISAECGVPVVLDDHHFHCYNSLHSDKPMPKTIDYYIPDVLETWKLRGIKPKFHISEQGCGRTGHHSDFITRLPDYYLEIPDKYGVDIDIMVEAKMKEQAIQHLYRVHRDDPRLNIPE